MSINKAIISGYIGRQPELRVTQSGTSVLTFSVAVNDRVPDGNNGWTDYANWINVTVFGKRADGFHKVLNKGDKVMIDGRLRYSTWKKDGKNYSKLGVIADNVDLAGGRRNDDQAPAPQSEPPAEPYQGSVYDEDIPF